MHGVSLVPSWTFEAVSDRNELARRMPAWRDLAKEERSSCFARPEWVIPYCEAFEPSPLVVFAYDGARLAGVFPCREGSHRLGRTLSTLGGEHIPELELVLSGDRAHLLGRFITWTFTRGHAELRLARASRDAETYGHLDRVLTRNRRMVYERVDRFQHHTRVASDFATFLRSQSKNFRKQMGRAQRAARDLGLTVDVLSDAQSIERALPDLERISRASWQGKNGTGTFANATYRGCYAAAALSLASEGRVRLIVCKKKEAPVGFILHFVDRDSLVALKSEFDESESACMAGWQIAALALDVASELGVGSVASGCFVTDFKERWTTHRSPSADLIVFAPSVAGSLSFAFPHLAKELVKRAWGKSSVARCRPLFDFRFEEQAGEGLKEEVET